MFKHRLLCLRLILRACLLLSVSIPLFAPKSALADPALSEVAPASKTEVPASASTMIHPPEQNDPLNSPYPVPWKWVMSTHTEVSTTHGSGMRYYRSPSLISPDGQYAAYSRIQLHIQPELYNTRVSSVMFLENLANGHLRAIAANSPLASNPLTPTEASQQSGTISILIPVAWSEIGDRILARQFEGLFSSSDASDYAVVWDRNTDQTSTISPGRIPHDIAVLLGWSQTHPDRVLFKAGFLGDPEFPLWAVKDNGDTLLATGDRPMTFGRLVNNIWAGPQAYR